MNSSEIETLSAIFAEHESEVRSYCRSFPTVFATARNAVLRTVDGRDYIDLLAGAGTLNYGHNNPAIIERVIAYLQDGGVVHSLDMHTTAKAAFIRAFEQTILRPRGLRYKLQFPGPTGTNAVEAAMKLARKVTRRREIVAFSNGFHGMTLGALAATANPSKRAGAGQPLDGVTFLPYEGYIPNADSIVVIEGMLRSRSSGVEPPAAFLIETVQGEGGLNAASTGFLRWLASFARDIGALLIIDDIQAGVGRTGSFFSFEGMGITPDIVCLSKALSGFGAPFSLVLLDPAIDIWAPGEHNGTFRGHNLAFVGATAAIDHYWRDDAFQEDIRGKATLVHDALKSIVSGLPRGAAWIKGRGLMTGLAFADPAIAGRAARRLFEDGVVIETCGHNDEVLKLLPPLTIPTDLLERGLELISRAVRYSAVGDAPRLESAMAS
jgi:diaminobutyrate-2-oxoglutarate transaminase